MLTGDEWLILKHLEVTLKTFIAATEKVSKAEVPLVYQIIPIIDRFNEIFTNLMTDDTVPLIIRHAAKLASAMLDKYYSLTDACKVYCISMIMHPKYKTYYFRHRSWPKPWVDEALRLVRNAWARYNRESDIASSITPAPAMRSKSSDISFDLDIDYEIDNAPNSEDALEIYLRSPPKKDVQDPIKHWNQLLIAGVDSKLARMSLDYLTAPGKGFIMYVLFLH
ncbi:MAG: hypothetical protein ACREHG_02955 [Candidatus Saccharimonadales bacterium]